MTCRQMQELVEPLAAGDLPLDVAMRAHIESCPSCAASLATARRIEALLADRPAPAAPDGFTAAVLQRIRRERWLVEQRVDRVFNAAMIAAGLLLVAGAALLLNVGAMADAAGVLADALAAATTNAVAAGAPAVGTYAAAVGLLLTGLFMWFWAEGAER